MENFRDIDQIQVKDNEFWKDEKKNQMIKVFSKNQFNFILLFWDNF
jgi:hypothetical protein